MLGQEGIAHVETFELPEVAVPGVKRAHAVLKEDGGELGVGHQVPTNHLVCGDALVSVQEAVLFRDSPDVGERQERGEVRWGVEDAMMRGSSGPAAHCAKKRLAAALFAGPVRSVGKNGLRRGSSSSPAGIQDRVNGILIRQIHQRVYGTRDPAEWRPRAGHATASQRVGQQLGYDRSHGPAFTLADSFHLPQNVIVNIQGRSHYV